MEGKMAAGAFGRARNYGWDDPFKESKLEKLYLTLPKTFNQIWIREQQGNTLEKPY